MFAADWIKRALGKSTHPMASLRGAGQLLQELAQLRPIEVVGEAAAMLESIHGEPAFTEAHRLRLAAMIDEAAHAAVRRLSTDYAMGRAGDSSSGQFGSPELLQFAFSGDGKAAAQGTDVWPVLADYLETLAAGYARRIDALSEQSEPDLTQRLPLFISRAMRAVSDRMALGWMRNLPPDLASWESLVWFYQVAESHGFPETLVHPYAADPLATCAQHEFAAAVMFAAAAPDSLTPSHIVLVHEIAHVFAGTFACGTEPGQNFRYYSDLMRPAPPARADGQAESRGSGLYFGPGTIVAKLRAVSVEVQEGSATRLLLTSGAGAAQALEALAHAARYWGESPPSRRYERTRLDSAVEVVVGIPDLQSAMRAGGGAPEIGSTVFPECWALTDFSSRGISARYVRRPAREFGIGTLFGFRIDRSQTWCLAVVRRMRREGYRHTDVGSEIIAKGVEHVSLELPAEARLQSGLAPGAVLQSHTILAPEAAGLSDQPSMFFWPGTNLPTQDFVMHRGGKAHRIRLGEPLGRLDGWDRIAFEWIG